MSFGQDFTLTLFTDDPALAARADRAGVDRIGVDLDRLDKHQRQGPGYRISEHREEDLLALRPAVRRARLFARTDPPHAGSRDQIERLLDLGAEVLMLPLFTRPSEAAAFRDRIAGRAAVSLLVETPEAARRIGEIVRLGCIDEVFVGLNDLHLGLGLASRFEVLVSGVLDRIAEAVRGAGIPFGFGGLGRVGETRLPVPSSLIYPHYPRLGGASALLARSFFLEAGREVDLTAEVARLRREMDRWATLPATECDRATEALRDLLGRSSGRRAA